jgi:hypothetical protein
MVPIGLVLVTMGSEMGCSQLAVAMGCSEPAESDKKAQQSDAFPEGAVMSGGFEKTYDNHGGNR